MTPVRLMLHLDTMGRPCATLDDGRVFRVRDIDNKEVVGPDPRDALGSRLAPLPWRVVLHAVAHAMEER